MLARHGRVYQAAKNWSQAHWTWIRAQRFDDVALARTLEASLEALEQALRRRTELDRAIEGMASEPRYRDAVGVLRCFRGINTLSAMILVAEIVDFERFHRPRALMAYLGLVPSEYSSGDRQRRGALTKAGNTHARRILVEAAWHYRHRPALGDRLARHTADHRRPSWPRPGARNSGCIVAIDTSSATASVRPSRSPPSRASWLGSSGLP